MSFGFKDGTTREIKDVETASALIRPTVLQALYYDDGKLKTRELGQIQTAQCRVIEYGDIYQHEDAINIIVGCNNGFINIYSLDNDLNITLLEQFEVPKKQVHSVYFSNTDADDNDEVFIGVDYDGIYHLDMQEEEALFKNI